MAHTTMVERDVSGTDRSYEPRRYAWVITVTTA